MRASSAPLLQKPAYGGPGGSRGDGGALAVRMVRSLSQSVTGLRRGIPGRRGGEEPGGPTCVYGAANVAAWPAKTTRLARSRDIRLDSHFSIVS